MNICYVIINEYGRPIEVCLNKELAQIRVVELTVCNAGCGWTAITIEEVKLIQ